MPSPTDPPDWHWLIAVHEDDLAEARQVAVEARAAAFGETLAEAEPERGAFVPMEGPPPGIDPGTGEPAATPWPYWCCYTTGTEALRLALLSRIGRLSRPLYFSRTTADGEILVAQDGATTPGAPAASVFDPATGAESNRPETAAKVGQHFGRTDALADALALLPTTTE